MVWKLLLAVFTTLLIMGAAWTSFKQTSQKKKKIYPQIDDVSLIEMAQPKTLNK